MKRSLTITQYLVSTLHKLKLSSLNFGVSVSGYSANLFSGILHHNHFIEQAI